VYRT